MKLSVTESLRHAAVLSLQQQPPPPSDVVEALEAVVAAEQPEPTVPLATAVRVREGLRRCDGTGSFRAALYGSRLVFPPPASRQPNAELQQRRALLQRRAADREYGQLVSGVCTEREKREQVGKLLPKLTIGANMIVAIFSTFIVCFVGAGSVTNNESWKLAAGLMGGVVIMFVEMVLFMLREHRNDVIEAEEVKKNKKHKKNKK